MRPRLAPEHALLVGTLPYTLDRHHCGASSPQLRPTRSSTVSMCRLPLLRAVLYTVTPME